MNGDLKTTKTGPQENNKYRKRWSFSSLPYRVTPFPPSGIKQSMRLTAETWRKLGAVMSIMYLSACVLNGWNDPRHYGPFSICCIHPDCIWHHIPTGQNFMDFGTIWVTPSIKVQNRRCVLCSRTNKYSKEMIFSNFTIRSELKLLLPSGIKQTSVMVA